MRGLLIAAAAFAAMPLTPVFAQAAEQACPSPPAPLTGPLAGWRDAAKVEARASAKAAGGSVAIGHAVDAGLHPAAHVGFVVAPAKPAGDTSGGLLSFTVPADGTYRVALGAGAWIDVIEDGKVVTSTSHGHGPACSGIRKMVDFPLKRGTHLLQIVGSPDATLRVLVTRLP